LHPPAERRPCSTFVLSRGAEAKASGGACRNSARPVCTAARAGERRLTLNDKDVTTVPNAHSAPPAALCAVRARIVDPDTEGVAADGALALDSAPMLQW